MFRNYLSELESLFGEDAMKVMLLKTTIAVYPLLTKFGISLCAPLAVVVDEKEQFKQVEEHLKGFSTAPVISLNQMPKEVKKHMKNSEYGLSFFAFSEGRYTRENLEAIGSWCAQINEKIDDQRIAVVLVSGGISYRYKDDFSGCIHIKDIRLSTGNTSGSGQKFLEDLIEKVLGKVDEIQYNIVYRCPASIDGFQALCHINGTQIELGRAPIQHPKIKQLPDAAHELLEKREVHRVHAMRLSGNCRARPGSSEIFQLFLEEGAKKTRPNREQADEQEN